MQIVVLTNKDRRFYQLIGPFLARREIEKETGYKLYDDDDKEWFVAIDGDTAIGFCYRQERPKGSYQIGSCYVVEEYRSKGVFKKLLAQAMQNIEGNVYLTTKNPALRQLLLSSGFEELGQRGSYTRYGRQL